VSAYRTGYRPDPEPPEPKAPPPPPAKPPSPYPAALARGARRVLTAAAAATAVCAAVPAETIGAIDPATALVASFYALLLGRLLPGLIAWHDPAVPAGSP
jgi:hypothetical protein